MAALLNVLSFNELLRFKIIKQKTKTALIKYCKTSRRYVLRTPRVYCIHFSLFPMPLQNATIDKCLNEKRSVETLMIP